ncbi:MAG: hypothetical protein EOO46_05170 [Flavobacterium sp.]|nr:MAG: hypothetical protein EOO46_05170 [Flavobacterium sp.]
MRLTKKIQLFLLAGIGSMLFTSCQNEENELINPSKETLSKSTPLTNMLQRVAMSDPTTDNIIDSTDCFKVKLPVEVLVNNQPILVTSEEDFATVEATFISYPSEYNTVDFVFPITVIYPDNSEVTIGSESEFYIKAHECEDVEIPVEEQPVGCLTIVYPLSLFTYDSEFQVADNLTFNSDAELWSFLDTLGPEDYYGINYPMTVIDQDGATITAQNNDELWAIITQAILDCNVVVPPGCDPGISFFQTAYDSLKGMSNVQELNSMDALVHEYKFEMKDAYRNICSIGYRGEQSATPVNYTIEIEDQQGFLVYSKVYAFSSTQTEYINVVNEFGGKITLTPNAVYTIRRIVQAGEATGIGRYIERSQNQGPQPPLLPFESAEIKILESRFYDGGGSTTSNLYSVPFIDIVFEF